MDTILAWAVIVTCAIQVVGIVLGSVRPTRLSAAVNLGVIILLELVFVLAHAHG